MAVSGCGAEAVPRGFQAAPANALSRANARSPIRHVVLVVQENRTFNNFFATFPGTDGTTTASVVRDPACRIFKSKTIALKKAPLVDTRDFDHAYQAYRTAWDDGRMDAFDEIASKTGPDECSAPYQYVDPSQIQPYWTIAKQYVLAEHMFSAQGSGSFTGHQDLIAAGTMVAPNEAMVNFPTCSGITCHWGCDAPAGTHTSLIDEQNRLQPGKGPFPCDKDFALKYPTLRDLLDAKGLSWKYYVPPPCCSTNGRLFAAYDIVHSIRYGPEWGTNVSWPQTNVFKDIRSGSLPAVSWLVPDGADSDHPGEKADHGPSWVANVVNAVGESSYWRSTAIIVVWDDWGGLYDSVAPPQHGYGGNGPRVPALVISAYAKAGYISRTQYQFAGILKYIEENWQLGYLGASDRHSTSIIDCFDYSQRPIAFKPISSEHSASYFIDRKPSNIPVDDDM